MSTTHRSLQRHQAPVLAGTMSDRQRAGREQAWVSPREATLTMPSWKQ